MAAFAGLLAAGEARARGEDTPTIAAAAGLNFVLPEIAELFVRETGRKVELSFGSSGNFARQIAQGAPFELFLSADETYVRFLSERALTQDGGVLYAVGRIVLFVPRGSSIKADVDLQDLALAVRDHRLKRFAIANPEHAPYGRAAKEVLIKAGLWEKLQGKLVLGENAAQAAQFAAATSVQAAIIPYSLAIAPLMKERGSYALIPAESHQPLRQRMVLIKGAGKTASMFQLFLTQAKARALFERHGFTLPHAEK